jgi:flagellar hook-basal body complex protein FliE
MGISPDIWLSTITEEWYGDTLTSDQFQQMWQEFLSSPEVKYLPANATPEDYHRLYLQFIAPHISQADPWFTQITQAAFGNTLTPSEVQELLKSFLELPEVLALPSSARAADFHQLYLRFLAQKILSVDPWYTNAIVQFFGNVTTDEQERILLDFLGSSEVLALPTSATTEDYQRLFVKFISSHLNLIHQAEAATAASPEAAAQSKVMWSIFELLAQMITTTSIAQIRDSEVINYLTQKRNEYAKMLSEVPLYTGSGSVDLSLAKDLSNKGVEGYVTIANNLQNINVGHWGSTLNVCEWYWTTGLIVTGATLKATLSTVLQGLVDQINATGRTTVYYDSPSYHDGTWSGGGYTKVMVIKVVKNDDGTFTAYWKRRGTSSTDESITDWNTVGTFKQSDSDVVTKVTNKPVLVSLADSVYTTISPNTDPTKFILGYGNITLQDLSASLCANYLKSTTPSSGFTLYSGDWRDSSSFYRNRVVINVTQENGNPKVSISLIQDTTTGSPAKNQDKTINWDACTLTSTVLQSTSLSLSDDDETTIENGINSSFLTIWQNATAAQQIQLTGTSTLNSYETSQTSGYQTYAMNARDPKIAWKSGILGSSAVEGQELSDYESNTLYTLNAATRAKINQRLQSYLSSISARMDVIGNISDQQQQVVDTSTSGLKTTNNLINASIQQMMQILTSMFR